MPGKPFSLICLSRKWISLVIVFVFLLSLFAQLFLFQSVSASSLSVQISADPSSGPAPLLDVDLSASVSGTTTGDITYKFDCTNDGSWERTITTSSTSFTAIDLCDYSSAGVFTAKIKVERESLSFEGQSAIFATSNPTLSVLLSPVPSSGSAPLNDVDLTATVSGSASGDITYWFDCTNNGSWERTITTSFTSFTAVDLCDYSATGTYTAKVLAERGSLRSEATASVVVFSSGSVSLRVVKLGRNITKNQTSFSDVIIAEPADRVEFKITVTAQGESSAQDILLKDTLPQNITFQNNLKIDGISISGNIFSGISFGNLSPNQSKTITFEVQIAGPENFTFGTTELINTALAYNEKIANSDALTIKVEKRGVLGAATSVPTGIFDIFSLSFIITLLSGFIFSYILLLRFYFKKQILPFISYTKTERKLSKIITQLKESEKDTIKRE